MIFSDTFKLCLIDRMGVRDEGGYSDMVLTFWGGPVPTFADFLQAQENLDITMLADNKVGRLSSRRFGEWLLSRGCVELATAYFGAENYYTVLDLQTSIFDVSTQATDFSIFAEGTATFFSVMNINYPSYEGVPYTIEQEVFHMLMGSVGLSGSGADQEISDVEIGFTKTIKPGTIKISIV